MTWLAAVLAFFRRLFRRRRVRVVHMELREPPVAIPSTGGATFSDAISHAVHPLAVLAASEAVKPVEQRRSWKSLKKQQKRRERERVQRAMERWNRP